MSCTRNPGENTWQCNDSESVSLKYWFLQLYKGLKTRRLCFWKLALPIVALLMTLSKSPYFKIVLAVLQKYKHEVFFSFKMCFFCVWYWGLNSGPTTWATPVILFCDGCFWDRVLQTIWTVILLMSASWVARIKDMSHWHPAKNVIYLKLFHVKIFFQFILYSQKKLFPLKYVLAMARPRNNMTSALYGSSIKRPDTKIHK
jgi:hypothetical protein